MKKILVPTDFSDCANAAADLAIYIASRAQAEVHFLHLLMTPVDWVKLPLGNEDLYPETKVRIGHARHELDELANKAEKAGVQHRISLVFDKGSEELTMHLDRYSHDFVVIGSHGTSENTELIGTNAQRVIRYDKSPVLVVKNAIPEPSFSNIVFASSYEEKIIEPFSHIIEFAQVFDANLHLVYINTPYDFRESEEMEIKMMRLIEHCGHGKCTVNIYNSLDEESGIERFAMKMNADLIAMTTHGKKGFMRLISPSITESLVNHSDFPVLSVNSNE